MNTPERNVDPREIAQFDAVADTWWDTEGDMRTLHEINPVRLGYMTARATLSGRRVVDVGCGGGILAEAMSQCGAQVLGVDMSAAALATARAHADAQGLPIDYRQMTVEELAVGLADQPADSEERYDIVTCMELLEHVPDPAQLVAACASLLRPGGHAFFSTINRTPKAWMLAVVGAEYVLGLIPRGTHEYKRFIKPSELNRWAGGAGLQLQDLSGMHYNPLLRTATIGPGVDVNYFAHYVAADAQPDASADD